MTALTKTVLCLLAALAVTGCAKPPQKPTTEPPAAPAPSPTFSEPTRFEIIQSTLSAKFTFRLDKFKGDVCQLVETSAKGLAWEEMRVPDLPATDSREKRVRFQLFTSTIAARHTYLIDLVTGNTWTLTSLTDDSDKEIETYWCPFAYQVPLNRRAYVDPKTVPGPWNDFKP